MFENYRFIRTVLAVSIPVLATPAATWAAESWITFAATQVVGGAVVEATLNVRSPSQTTTNYRLQLTGPAGPPAPDEEFVRLPAGKAAVTFTFRTRAVAQTQNATVCLSLTPPACEVSAQIGVVPPRLVSLTFGATTVASGNPFQGQVALDGPAPPGGFVVDLAQSPPPTSVGSGLCPSSSVVAAAPDSVTIGQGASSKAFTVPTYYFNHNVDGPQAILVVARAGGIEKSQTLTVERLRIASASISPTSGVKPLNATATFSLNGPAPSSFEVGVMLQPSAPSGVTVTGEATFPAGQQSGSFPVVVDKAGNKSEPIPPTEVYIVGGCARDRLLGVVQLFAPPQ